MSSPNEARLLEQQVKYENLTLRPKRWTVIHPDTKVAQDQARQENDVVSSICSAANGASPGGEGGHDDRRLAGPSGRGTQNGIVRSESSEVSSLAPAAFRNDATEEVEAPESRPPITTNNTTYTLPSHAEFRDTWHNCDGCGNTIRCSFRTPQAKDEDGGAYEEWNGYAEYDAMIVPPGQGWNIAWDAARPPTEAGDETEARNAIPEEEPLYLLVKYNGSQKTGEYVPS